MADGGTAVEPIQARCRSLVSSGRLVRFASVGLLGAAVDFAVLVSLVEFWGLRLELGKIVSAETAILVMFALNESWTFSEWGEPDYRSVLRRLGSSNVVRLGGLAVATVVLSLLVRLLAIPYLLANTVGIACGFSVNFLTESYFTWSVGQ